MTIRSSVALLALVAVLGCRADEALAPPASAGAYDGRFLRYVSLGNSIAAGFQSGGINDSTQQQAFPVLFAEAVGTPFTWPRLAGRGCPAPLTNNVTETRVGDQPPESPCDLRQLPPPEYLNNLAVPGLGVRDIFSNTASGPGTYASLTQFFLGGRTQMQWLMQARPTFVTVEVGPNDVLGALLAGNAGDSDEVTDPAVFEAEYRRLGDSLAVLGTDAALFLIPDVTLIPFTSTGSTYWCIRNQPACGITTPTPFPPTFTVNNNCAPDAAIPGAKGDSILVPWTRGVPLIAAAAQGAPTELDCSNDTDVVSPAEFLFLKNALAANNAVIADVADEHGWALVDVNPDFAAYRADGTIPPFPDLSQALTGGSVGFGPLFSLDGFHPSGQAQALIAELLIATVNEHYGLSIP